MKVIVLFVFGLTCMIRLGYHITSSSVKHFWSGLSSPCCRAVHQRRAASDQAQRPQAACDGQQPQPSALRGRLLDIRPPSSAPLRHRDVDTASDAEGQGQVHWGHACVCQSDSVTSFVLFVVRVLGRNVNSSWIWKVGIENNAIVYCILRYSSHS